MAPAAASLLDAETFSGSSSRDALGRVLTAMSPDGSEVHYGYDEGGALEQVTLNHRGSVTTQTVVGDITYDAKGRRETVVYGPTGAPTSTTTYTYDELSQRLIRLRTVRASDSEAIQSLHYHYDPVGNIADIRDSAQQTVYFDNTVVAAANSYTYDALYRLVEATGREHSSEGTGQRTDADMTATAQPMASDPSAMRLSGNVLLRSAQGSQAWRGAVKDQLILVSIGISLAVGCRSPDSSSGSTHPLDDRAELNSGHEDTPLPDAVSARDEETSCARVPSGILSGIDVPELCMDITETTVEQFRRCVDAGKCSVPEEKCFGATYHWTDRQQYPANCVTQEQASTYCSWQNKRLPTALEWQWEAQGGGENRRYPWGDALPNCDYANLYFGLTIEPSALGQCGRDFAPVGSFPLGASLHGILDLQGSVSEWTSDFAASGTVTGVVVMGVAATSDFSHEELDPSEAQLVNPSLSTSLVGFRCVRELQSPITDPN